MFTAKFKELLEYVLEDGLVAHHEKWKAEIDKCAAYDRVMHPGGYGIQSELLEDIYAALKERRKVTE